MAGSQVAFSCGDEVVATTLPPEQAKGDKLQALITGSAQEEPRDVEIGKERFLATSLELSGSRTTPVRLSVLGSYDQATKFIDELNRYLLLLGIGGHRGRAAGWCFSFRTLLRGRWAVWSPASELSKAATFIIRWIHAEATKSPN